MTGLGMTLGTDSSKPFMGPSLQVALNTCIEQLLPADNWLEIYVQKL